MEKDTGKPAVILDFAAATGRLAGGGCSSKRTDQMWQLNGVMPEKDAD